MHIIYTHIFSLLNSYQILCDNQYGFRQGRSCEAQLPITIDDLAKNLNNNLQTDIIFSKAFDKVNHSCLLHKLHNYGIRSSLQSWLENFLTQRTQHVTIERHYSSTINVTLENHQGSVLIPLPFLCFINDLPIDIKSKIKLYVDNVLLYSTISSPDDCH